MRSRSLTVDAFKAVAAQLIVLHHFAAYSPMANTLSLTWGGLVNALFEDARMVVQVFLVSSGYLVARSVSNLLRVKPLPMIVKRYFRLLPAYVVALIFTVCVASLMRDSIDGATASQELESWLPGEATWTGFLGHILMLQNVLHLDALTVGVWYVSIDMQLFVLTLLLMWLLELMRGERWVSGQLILVTVLSQMSLWVFNLNPDLDDYAVYFFGAYGLGLLSFWATLSARGFWAFMLSVLLGMGAYAYAPRARVAIAIGTALCLYLATREGAVNSIQQRAQFLHLLSDSSYALFLNHFAVIIVLSGVWYELNLQTQQSAWIFIMTGWIMSLALSLWVYRYMERPLSAWTAERLGRLWAREP